MIIAIIVAISGIAIIAIVGYALKYGGIAQKESDHEKQNDARDRARRIRDAARRLYRQKRKR